MYHRLCFAQVLITVLCIQTQRLMLQLLVAILSTKRIGEFPIINKNLCGGLSSMDVWMSPASAKTFSDFSFEN